MKLQVSWLQENVNAATGGWLTATAPPPLAFWNSQWARRPTSSRRPCAGPETTEAVPATGTAACGVCCHEIRRRLPSGVAQYRCVSVTNMPRACEKSMPLTLLDATNRFAPTTPLSGEKYR